MIRSLSLSVVLLAAIASPAAAAQAGRTELNLSYQAEVGYAGAVVLRCNPPAGAHPARVKACKALTKVKGDPARLKPGSGLCTMEYAPVDTRIEGTWRGKKVAWSKRFGNACTMRVAMGQVMAF